MPEQIVTISKEELPTILSYNAQDNSYVIGIEARKLGLQGKTNAYNFKPEIGQGSATFSKIKKYWVATAPTSARSAEALTTKQVAVRFLRELLIGLELPEKIILGEPPIKEQAWKDNYRRHMREVFDELGLKAQISFFPEPFAVFQYYRHYEKKFPKGSKSELILIIDVGAGTFSSCIIKTTESGALARGGATALPLGLQAEQCGGSKIDDDLLHLVVEKARKQGIVWKDDPFERAKNSRVPVLLHIEDAKISLSNKIGAQARVSDDHTDKRVNVHLIRGSLHSEKDINIELNGEDLKQVIRELWRREYGNIIAKTINEAQEKLGTPGARLKLDKILIAGGSSRLPFMAEEVATVLPTRVEPDNIYIGSDIGTSVALGIACECLEQMSRDPSLSTGKLAPCLMNDLYLGFRKSRRDPMVGPRIKLNGGDCMDGQLFSAPFQTDELTLRYELYLPFEPKGNVFYCFTDQPLTPEADIMNFSHTVFQVTSTAKVMRKCELEIQISENGMVKPTFFFREKGKGSSKAPIIIGCPEFHLPNITIREGENLIGIDFGTCNSYVAKIIGAPEEEPASQYPEFKVKARVLDKLRQLELELQELRANGILNHEAIMRHAEENELLVVFHSNKIEGNPLNKGETEKAIESKAPHKLSTRQREAYNLEKACKWILEHLESCQEEPEAFIRQINKMILEGILNNGGDYRKKPVKISGVDFAPPESTSLPAFMRSLGEEIKVGPSGRSVLEFAATLHTKLVWIHPFTDANGRTARLLLNAILLSYELPIVVVNYADKQRYLEALEDANRGDISSFITFVLETFQESLERLKTKCFDNEFYSKEDEAIVASRPIPILTANDDPIRTAFEERGLMPEDENDDPLVSVMKSKIGQIRLRELNYEAWKQGYTLMKTQLNSIVERFNSNYNSYQYSAKTADYGILPFETYIDIEEGRQFRKTWFLGLEVTGPNTRERFVLFFNRLADGAPQNWNKVSLTLARHDGTYYQRITTEPVSLREIVYVDGELVSLCADGSQVKNIMITLKTLLAEIIKSYL